MGYTLRVRTLLREVYDDDPLKRQVSEVTITESDRHPFTVRLQVVGLIDPPPFVREIAVEDPDGIQPRQVRDVPIATYVQAAVLAVRDWDLPAAGRVLSAPRGRPEHGTDFYRELADFYVTLVRNGEAHPAKEIARRKRVSANSVYQWIYRARELGFLERKPTRKGRTT
ncbi:MAG: hypothetical protein ACXWYT_00910 [Actinomycetota bacterium]